MLKTAFLPTHSTAYWSLLAAKIIYLFILVCSRQAHAWQALSLLLLLWWLHVTYISKQLLKKNKLIWSVNNLSSFRSDAVLKGISNEFENKFLDCPGRLESPKSREVGKDLASTSATVLQIWPFIILFLWVLVFVKHTLSGSRLWLSKVFKKGLHFWRIFSKSVSRCSSLYTYTCTVHILWGYPFISLDAENACGK